MAQLSELLGRAGFDTFREARHPLGLTQRQSNGKFTRAEARELIDRLGDAPPSDVAADVASETLAEVAPVSPDTVAMAFPDELLADELVRRGWTCTPPPAP